VEKTKLKTEKDRNLLKREREILISVDHPFILKLVRSFKDEDNVYFLTELVTGGELLDVLDHLDRLNRYQTQFYLGSIAVALEYLHEKLIVYRDLKPENVMVDAHGFVKLIDFGAAKKVDSATDKNYTLLGTPQFMAPEMVLSQGYTSAADMWAMGVCMHEFMLGRLPFDGKDQLSIFKAIVSKKAVKIPEDVLNDDDARDLLTRLLLKNPEARMQPTSSGYREFRNHAFFSDFHWGNLIGWKAKPPLIPKQKKFEDDDEQKWLSEPLKAAVGTSTPGDWDEHF